jgi:hypothetical protein
MRVRRLEWSLWLVLAAGVGACDDPSPKCSSCSQPAPPDPQPTDNPSDASATVADAGVKDAGTGTCCDMMKPVGPWPTADVTTYSIGADIIDSTPDDGQNIWAASHDTLFVLKPGQTSFQPYTAADGLHIGGFIDPDNNPNTTWITAIAAGHANEVFVGYYGYETEGNPYLDTDAQKQLGNADKVTLDASGKITTLRYLFRCNYDSGSGCWENRSPRRMVYVHDGIAAGHLFIGFNHGVSHVENDQIGDHVHPEIIWHYPTFSGMKLGEFYGIAPDAKGNLWMAGRYGVGLQPWNPIAPFKWVDAKFLDAFTIYGDGHGLDVPAGYVEENSGVAVMPNGVVYISSFTKGLTRWDPATITYATMTQVSGVPGQIRDIAADSDGTLWIVDVDGGLSRHTPSTGETQPWPGISGAHRVVVDTSVNPRAVYVSFNGGLCVIRAK